MDQFPIHVNPIDCSIVARGDVIPFPDGKDTGGSVGRKPIGAVAESEMQGGLLINPETRRAGVTALGNFKTRRPTQESVVIDRPCQAWDKSKPPG